MYLKNKNRGQTIGWVITNKSHSHLSAGRVGGRGGRALGPLLRVAGARGAVCGGAARLRGRGRPAGARRAARRGRVPARLRAARAAG